MGEKPEEEILNGIDGFMAFLDVIDEQLMMNVIKPNETYWAAYQYFDSVPWKPLNPREFLQFWECLSDVERLMLLLEIG